MSEEGMKQLKELVDDHIARVRDGSHHCDDDDDHYIYEAAVEAFYGKEIWKEFNEE